MDLHLNHSNLKQEVLSIAVTGVIKDYRGFLPYAIFGTWKKIALAKFLSYERSTRLVRHLILLQTHKCSLLFMGLHIFEIKLC